LHTAGNAYATQSYFLMLNYVEDVSSSSDLDHLVSC
jgi:hypothetical protein